MSEQKENQGASAEPTGLSSPTEPQERLGPSGFDPSRGVREQVFRRIQVVNGCVAVECASILSDHCGCMDDYEKQITIKLETLEEK